MFVDLKLYIYLMPLHHPKPGCQATSHCHFFHRHQLQLAIMGIEVRRIGAGRAPHRKQPVEFPVEIKGFLDLF